MRRGAIILCGGNSTRMGTAKALLPFGPELMLQRVVRLVGEVVPPANIIVVAAAGQQLPSLPPEIAIACDRRPECGPLEGLAAGLSAFDGQVEAVYATGCDVPLLVPAFVERLFGLLGDYDIVVPREEKFHHPLAAVYRPQVLSTIETLLAADRFRPVFLFDQHPTREVAVDELREVDPELATLANCNSPEDYQQTLLRAGYATDA